MSGPPLSVAVLASGEGTNLQAILETLHGRGLVEVVAVGSDRREAGALARAAQAAVPSRAFELGDYVDRRRRDLAIADWLDERGTGLVVLAGYMQLLDPGFLERFVERVINVHPALLPSFPGLDAIGQAYRHGVRVSGVTVHFVDAGVDTGPIILQEPIELAYTRPIAEFEAEIHRVEHRLLPHAIELIAAGAVRVDDHNRRLVKVDEQRD
jgi:phosphoribosylglycinamide formyltransferase-1